MIWAFGLVGLAVAVVIVVALRQTLGRERPDLLAWVSFDDGPFAFAKTYKNGRVGPFDVGQTRAQAVGRLSDLSLLEEDRPQLHQNAPKWRVSLPARSGGYVTYTVRFDHERVRDVQAYYAILAGL
jgi:hypothetical protein